MIPAVIISGQFGFKALYITRSLVRLEGVAVNLVALYILIKQSPWKMFVNIIPEVVACTVMALVGWMLLKFNDNLVVSFVWICLCAVVYFIMLSIFPKDRNILIGL